MHVEFLLLRDEVFVSFSVGWIANMLGFAVNKKLLLHFLSNSNTPCPVLYFALDRVLSCLLSLRLTIIMCLKNLGQAGIVQFCKKSLEWHH